MGNNSIVSKLKTHLEAIGKEQFNREWEESSEFDNIGPTIEEYSEFLKESKDEFKTD